MYRARPNEVSVRYRRIWPLGMAAALAIAMLGGCIIVPVPAKTRTEGAWGPAKLELNELKMGVTKREGVSKRLEPFLVPVEGDKFLWARFSKSSSAILWAVGGYGGAAGGGERNWGMHNLFTIFSEDGTLISMREAGDSELHASLRGYMKTGELRVAEPGEPVVLDVVHRHKGRAPNEASVKMTLSPDAVLLDEFFSAKHSFHLKPSQIKELSFAGTMKQDSKPYAGSILESLRFRDEKGKEHRWSVYVSAGDLPVLLRYYDTVVASAKTGTKTN